MIGQIFITRSGYDPEYGMYVKDPYLGNPPSLGACRPDIRRRVRHGDHIFVISGRVPEARQYVMGGFEVEAKMPASVAYQKFPHQRLHLLKDGQPAGNVIVNSRGEQHKLDNHAGFERRIRDYVIGKNCISLVTPGEIALGRSQTMDVLCEILKKRGKTPVEVLSRFGKLLTEEQAIRLRDWLRSLKEGA